MRCAVGIALERNGGNTDGRSRRESLSQIVVLGLALGEAEPPAVIVNDDGDVVRIIQSCRAAVKRGIVEVPIRRSDLPNELRELAPIFVVAIAAALRGKIVLIPPLKLRLWGQRYLAGFLVADQITAYGNQGLAAFRPQGRDNVGRACPPIKPRQRRFSILSASINATTSAATAACWPLRSVSLERNRVVP